MEKNKNWIDVLPSIRTIPRRRKYNLSVLNEVNVEDTSLMINHKKSANLEINHDEPEEINYAIEDKKV